MEHSSDCNCILLYLIIIFSCLPFSQLVLSSVWLLQVQKCFKIVLIFLGYEFIQTKLEHFWKMNDFHSHMLWHCGMVLCFLLGTDQNLLEMHRMEGFNRTLSMVKHW